MKEAAFWATKASSMRCRSPICRSRRSLGQRLRSRKKMPWRGDLDGQQVSAIQPMADDSPAHFGCVKCGAYVTSRFKWLRAACRLARSAQRPRKRDAMLAGRAPARPHNPFFATSFISFGEADWLRGKDASPGDTTSGGQVPEATSPLLRPFGGMALAV